MEVVANFRKNANCSAYIELLQESSFATHKDNYGSTIDSPISVVDGVLTVNYSMAPQVDVWPWTEIDLSPKLTNLANLCDLAITYKSDHKIRVELPQVPLSSEGFNFGFDLPVTADWSTVVIKKTDWAKPSWATDTTSLNLNVITYVMFSPLEYGITGKVDLQSVKLYGYESTVSVDMKTAVNKDFQIFSLNNNSIGINSDKQGDYLMQVFTVEGKLVACSRVALSQGLQSVDLNANLQAGTYIVKLTGGNQVHVAKFALIR